MAAALYRIEWSRDALCADEVGNTIIRAFPTKDCNNWLAGWLNNKNETQNKMNERQNQITTSTHYLISWFPSCVRKIKISRSHIHSLNRHEIVRFKQSVRIPTLRIAD